MNDREYARELLHKIHSCRPKFFFGKIDETARGIGFVLNFLLESDHEVIAGELSRELGVSTARIAAMLKAMEKNGLVERSRSSQDARQTVVKITKSGVDYVEELREQILQKTELLVKRVGKKDLEEFVRISNRIREALGE